MTSITNNIGQQQQQPMAIIKRAQHNIKLATVLNNMYQCGSLVDVTIYCDDGELHAHKLVLAAASSYFRSLFTKISNTYQYPIIVLREMSINDLKTIIEFIYHGEVNVPQNRVDSLMRCANYLQIEGMASSANSLNAILASSSSMSHHPLFTAHTTAQVSASANNIHSSSLNKIHLQYPPAANCKQSRGHSSRNNNNANNNSSNNTNSSNTNDNTNSSGKPKHTCPVCLKTFTHGFTLKRHMKLHSQSRIPIQCDICSKSYSCKDSYLRHKKSSGHLQHAEFHHRSIDMNVGSNR